jgi:hypothetical protein
VIRANAPGAFLLLVLNLFLNWRIFLPGVTPYRGSIERGYAYMANWVAQHPDPWGWNPFQYCGLPTHFVYLPLLPYWNALWIRAIEGVDPTQVHRVTCAAALCLGVVSVYLFARYFGTSRRLAFCAGLVVTFCSPLYLLINTIKNDQGLFKIPWRIQVLLKYGEGPHTVGLALMPLALIAVHRCAVRRSFGSLWLAAAALAAVVLTNWVAGLALALLVVILLLTHFGESGFSVRRVLAAGVLGYLLAAFWLTPSFVLRMVSNWPQDAFGYQLQGQERMALMLWIGGLLVLWLLCRWRFRDHRYFSLLLLATYCFGFLVTCFYAYGLNALPESRRYALEYELFLLLLVVESIRLLMTRRPWLARAGLLAFLLQSTPLFTRFVSHGYEPWVPVAREQTPEFRVASALAARQPTGRLLLSGGSRFRFNSWFLYPQIGGVFETGLRNRLPVDIAYQVRTDLGSKRGEEAANSMLQLRALGVEYIVVHGPNSEEYYRDVKYPDKFEGVLDKVWGEGDDRIYRLEPVRYAHLVTAGELPAYPPKGGYFQVIAPYVAAMSDPARPTLAFNWQGPSAATISGSVPAGHRVAVAISYEDGWQAWQDGAAIPLERNELGFFTVVPRAAAQTEIQLRYGAPLETRLAAGVSAICWLGCLLFWLRSRRTHA